MDSTSGAASSPTVRAQATMTLALPKIGLMIDAARPFVGELYLANIGVPPALYAQPSLGVVVPNLFCEDDIIRLA